MRLFCLIVIFTSLAACDLSDNSEVTNYCNRIKLSGKVGYQPTQKEIKLNYQAHIKPIIDQQCMSCHGLGQQYPDLTNWEDLKKADYALAKKVVEKVLNGDMPKVHPLNSKEQDQFLRWQNEGFAYEHEGQEAFQCAPIQTAPSVKSAD